MKQGTQSWCSGTTRRDAVGREMGGAFKMGTHVHLWLIHVNVWQKPLQYCKIISLQLNKFREGNGTPLQYSCLENPMDRGAWWATVNGVSKSQKWLSDFTFTFHFHALEKERATHSSVLAWRIPGMGEPGGLPSMGSHRIGHDWSDLAAAQQNK